MQMVFCEPRLGKVGSGRRVTKVSLYYGTNCHVPFSLMPAMARWASPSVRYITDTHVLSG
jgi:hypothetical protein